MADTELIDGMNRRIEYLRMSVTDRCDFRCVYCMAEDMTFLPRQQVLSLEEMQRLAALFVAHGVKKIRLTGGRASGPSWHRRAVRCHQRHSRIARAGDDHQWLAAGQVRPAVGRCRGEALEYKS